MPQRSYIELNLKLFGPLNLFLPRINLIPYSIGMETRPVDEMRMENVVPSKTKYLHRSFGQKYY